MRNLLSLLLLLPAGLPAATIVLTPSDISWEFTAPEGSTGWNFTGTTDWAQLAAFNGIQGFKGFGSATVARSVESTGGNTFQLNFKMVFQASSPSPITEPFPVPAEIEFEFLEGTGQPGAIQGPLPTFTPSLFFGPNGQFVRVNRFTPPLQWVYDDKNGQWHTEPISQPIDPLTGLLPDLDYFAFFSITGDLTPGHTFYANIPPNSFDINPVPANAAVPEPSGLALVGGGILLLLRHAKIEV
jgi:hypothetical protein